MDDGRAPARLSDTAAAWGLLEAVAWIMFREPSIVVEAGQENRQPGTEGILALRLDLDYAVAILDNPEPTLYGPVKTAVGDFLRRLRGGELTARADGPKGMKIDMQPDDWRGLELCEEDGGRVLEPAPTRLIGRRWFNVTVRRDDVVRLWPRPDSGHKAQVIEAAGRLAAAGYLPVANAISIIAHHDPDAIFRLVPEELAFDARWRLTSTPRRWSPDCDGGRRNPDVMLVRHVLARVRWRLRPRFGRQGKWRGSRGPLQPLAGPSRSYVRALLHRHGGTAVTMLHDLRHDTECVRLARERHVAAFEAAAEAICAAHARFQVKLLGRRGTWSSGEFVTTVPEPLPDTLFLNLNVTINCEGWTEPKDSGTMDWILRRPTDGADWGDIIVSRAQVEALVAITPPVVSVEAAPRRGLKHVPAAAVRRWWEPYLAEHLAAGTIPTVREMATASREALRGYRRLPRETLRDLRRDAPVTWAIPGIKPTSVRPNRPIIQAE